VHGSGMKRFLIALTVVFFGVITMIEIDTSSDEFFDFPILGQIAALIDLRLDQPNWYVYGLMSGEALENRREQLKPYGITVVNSGCVVGGPTYKRDRAYNNTIYKGLSAAAQNALRAY
jgi:hypothetical protein